MQLQVLTSIASMRILETNNRQRQIMMILMIARILFPSNRLQLFQDIHRTCREGFGKVGCESRVAKGIKVVKDGDD